jgi:hypothetical protein
MVPLDRLVVAGGIVQDKRPRRAIRTASQLESTGSYETSIGGPALTAT